MDFRPYPKTPRLASGVVITEKIDGTNAAIVISSEPRDANTLIDYVITDVGSDGGFVDYSVWAQSRNRFITPEADNYGFAAWVERNAEQLVVLLGRGVHYGELWGKGVARGYGLNHRCFSLFDTRHVETLGTAGTWVGDVLVRTVPVVVEGEFSPELVAHATQALRGKSWAADGYEHPEGMVVRFDNGGARFKIVWDKAGPPKPPKDPASAKPPKRQYSEEEIARLRAEAAGRKAAALAAAGLL